MTKAFLLTGLIALGLTVNMTTAEAKGGRDARGAMPDFATLDADGSGEVTLDELKAQALARFDAADSDGNGELSAEELAAQAKARDAERAAKRVERQLQRMDRDGDGVVTRADVEAGGERAERMLSRLDRDGSGGLSQEEMARLGKRGKKGERGQRAD